MALAGLLSLMLVASACGVGGSDENGAAGATSDVPGTCRRATGANANANANASADRRPVAVPIDPHASRPTLAAAAYPA